MAAKNIALFVNGGIGGGFENQGVPALMQLVNEFSKHHNVTVFSMVNVPDFNPTGFKFISSSAGFYDGFIKLTFKGFSTFNPFIKKQPKFDLIHAFGGLPAGYLAVQFGNIYKVPVLVTFLGGEAAAVKEINYGHLLKWKNRMLLKSVVRLAKSIVFLSAFQKQKFESKIQLKANVKTIPIGADVNQFAFKDRSFSDPISFLHIGNLTPVKGQKNMLEVFSKVSAKIPSNLVIAGDGELRSELENYAETLGIKNKVIFAGAVNHNSLPTMLHDADFLLQTSLFESQGVVFAEAASCGTVICSTKVGLASDLGDTVAVLSEVGNVEELANKISAVCTNPNQFHEYQKNAYAWAKQNSISQTVTSYLKLYQEITV